VSFDNTMSRSACFVCNGAMIYLFGPFPKIIVNAVNTSKTFGSIREMREWLDCAWPEWKKHVERADPSWAGR